MGEKGLRENPRGLSHGHCHSMPPGSATQELLEPHGLHSVLRILQARMRECEREAVLGVASAAAIVH